MAGNVGIAAAVITNFFGIGSGLAIGFFIRFLQTIDVISRLGFVNVFYGPIVEEIMHILNEIGTEIKLPESVFYVSQDYFMKSNGKLTKYDVSISLFQEQPLYLTLYIIFWVIGFILNRVPTHIITIKKVTPAPVNPPQDPVGPILMQTKKSETNDTQVIRTERKFLRKFKKMISTLWAVSWGMIVLDVLYFGLHDLCHTLLLYEFINANVVISLTISITVCLMLLYDTLLIFNYNF